MNKRWKSLRFSSFNDEILIDLLMKMKLFKLLHFSKHLYFNFCSLNIFQFYCPTLLSDEMNPKLSKFLYWPIHPNRQVWNFELSFKSFFVFIRYTLVDIRDIGKSSSQQIITNSEREIITENTFIINFFLIDDYFSFLQYLIVFSYCLHKGFHKNT
jgi:hypothetical protein